MKALSIFLAVIFCAGSTLSCLTSTSGTSASPKAAAPSPVSTGHAKLDAINAELVSISSETSKLQEEEIATQNQRNESLLALSDAHGHGPHMVHGISDGEVYIDPGMMISMHNQNVTIANTRLGEIRTQIATLTAKESKLKNDRAAIEATLPTAKGQSPIGSCFTPDTLILTKNGVVPIGRAATGQKVLTFNEATGENSYQPIIEAVLGQENHYYIINRELRVTGLHRFMTDQGWMRAAELEEGMLLQTTDGLKPIESIHYVQATLAVANLEVEKDHDFYVFGGKTAYLVHNTGGGGGGGGGGK